MWNPKSPDGNSLRLREMCDPSLRRRGLWMWTIRYTRDVLCQGETRTKNISVSCFEMRLIIFSNYKRDLGNFPRVVSSDKTCTLGNR